MPEIGFKQLINQKPFNVLNIINGLDGAHLALHAEPGAIIARTGVQAAARAIRALA